MSWGVNSLLDDLWNGYREGDGISEPLDIEEETLKIIREGAIPIEWVAIPQDGQALDSAESALPYPSFMNRWQAFIAQFEPGDELREFCSSFGLCAHEEWQGDCEPADYNELTASSCSVIIIRV